MPFKRIRAKINQFWRDEDGSEAVEMVMTTAMIVVFIIVGLSIMSYVVELNNVNFATKQVARQVEVTGYWNTVRAENLFNAYIGSSLDVPPDPVDISNVSFLPGKRIQLKDTFRVTANCTYKIEIINPGSFTGFHIPLDIRCIVTGMSEVYWAS